MSENMPSFEISKDKVEGDGIGILDLLVMSKLAPSKGEARRLVTQGGISVNDEKINSIEKMIKNDDFTENYVIIKKGKKTFMKIVLM